MGMTKAIPGCRPLLALAACLACAGWTAVAAGPSDDKIDPRVIDAAFASPSGKTEFLVLLREQADLSGAAKLQTKAEKGRYVFEALTRTANYAQEPLLASLRRSGVPHRSFWVANMIWACGDLHAAFDLAGLPDVARISANASVRLQLPAPPATATLPAASVAGIEWNIAHVRAPEVWALGFRGQGVVVGGQDTGYQWDHPALKAKYRGWNGTNAVHDYNWHDAIHSGGGGCGPNAPAPCDDHGHGTHTMGTMVGDDGLGNQIGMAPGAVWIGCRNMDVGVGTPATYAECFQWFMAPTDVYGNNPDPSKAPDVINNSWGCPPSEGCTDVNVLRDVVEHTRAAGIVVVVSAGNSGSGCGSVDGPPAIYEASFTVGATDSSDYIASFSSRGPWVEGGTNHVKPDISAPGANIRSSVPGGYQGGWSGTSMAGPHVAGLVALILSAHPGLRGHVDQIERLVERTAVPRTTTSQSCGDVDGTQVPNNTYGWGRIDALAAVGVGDADGDGMPDWWEVVSGLNPTNAADASLDSDGDGASNWQEFIANTDPNNSNSFLHMTAIAMSASGVASVAWSSVQDGLAAARSYDVYRADTLTGGATNWVLITTGLPSAGAITTSQDTPADPAGPLFYRVGIAGSTNRVFTTGAVKATTTSSPLLVRRPAKVSADGPRREIKTQRGH